MASLTFPVPRAAKYQVVAALPHAMMLAAMAFTMLAPHSAGRMLLAAALLVTTSILCARRARTDPLFRDHLIDLWAMVLVLIALVPGGTNGFTSPHEHLMLPHGLASTVVITVGWAFGRTLSARHRWRRSWPSAAVFFLATVVMIGLCR
ncbi:hypothetical protein BH09ACT1_BH09ACT1_29260 [soil metagenome]